LPDRRCLARQASSPSALMIRTKQSPGAAAAELVRIWAYFLSAGVAGGPQRIGVFKPDGPTRHKRPPIHWKGRTGKWRGDLQSGELKMGRRPSRVARGFFHQRPRFRLSAPARRTRRQHPTRGGDRMKVQQGRIRISSVFGRPCGRGEGSSPEKSRRPMRMSNRAC